MADRKYRCKDVDMLTAAKTMTQHFIEHKEEIISIRSTWSDPFIEELATRIDHAISHYLGLDPKKDQRLATQLVEELQKKSLKSLSLFKINIESDYSTDTTRLEWLLTTLGFSSHYKAAQTRDQEALIQLLQQFKLNMTADLKAEITGKGTSETLIDELIAQADPLKDANIEQETLKADSKAITQEAVEEFNEIYTQIMAIGKITARLFQTDTVKREKFTFDRIVNALNVRN